MHKLAPAALSSSLSLSPSVQLFGRFIQTTQLNWTQLKRTQWNRASDQPKWPHRKSLAAICFAAAAAVAARAIQFDLILLLLL